MSTCLHVCLSVCLIVYLLVLSVCQSVGSACLPVCLSVCLPACLCVFLPVCVSILLSVCDQLLVSHRFTIVFLVDSQGSESDSTQVKATADHQSMPRRWDFIVPRAANDSATNLKKSKKEMQKLKKQIAIRKRLEIHQQQYKGGFLEDYGSPGMLSPPSHYQITQWNKHFKHKTRKVCHFGLMSNFVVCPSVRLSVCLSVYLSISFCMSVFYKTL